MMTPSPATENELPSAKAAVYVRMSTEHQQYSTNNQMDAICEYALRRNIEIVKVYSDEGKSGLSIHGRESFSRMIADVKAGSPGFSCILVYDVSRWGRFQDADESAYYQHLCRRANILAHYCAEQFENDGSPVSTIVTGVKRAMAGEYSRELSSKVYRGACRLIGLGYKQGGAAGYGLRRMLVDQAGQSKGLLAHGEQKSIQTDRVVLIPGPDDEQADMIDQADDMPSSAAFQHRFGSLVAAYALIGYTPPADLGFIEINRWIRNTHPELMGSVADSLRGVGAGVEMGDSRNVLHVNGEIRVSVSLCRHWNTAAGASRWVIMMDQAGRPDITIAARLASANNGIRDYYLLPSIDVAAGKLRLAEANGTCLDGYRFDDLSHFFTLAQRTQVGRDS